MDARLNSNRVYAIADALGLTLHWDEKARKLTGETQRDVMFGDQTIVVDVKVVSSLVLSDEYLVMAKVMGNLGLLAVSYRSGKDDCLSLHLLNQAKLDTFTGWLEKNKPRTRFEARSRLGAAIVKSFNRVGKNSWKEAE